MPNRHDQPAANTTLRTLYKAEAAIIAAYGWMPYPSDMEAEEPRRNLYTALDAVAEGLDEVRKLKDELEKAILAEATR